MVSCSTLLETSESGKKIKTWLDLSICTVILILILIQFTVFTNPLILILI